MGPDHSFSHQFFAVAPTTHDRRVLLAGGLHPMSGSRSAYRATVACYDYAERRVVWLSDKTKSYPFRAITHAGSVCAAMLPQNFVGQPQGMFRFDLETGEPIQPDFELRGWKIEFVNAWGAMFLFSWVVDEVSFMRAVNARDAAFHERSFPYQSTSAGKTIERVIPTGNDTFAAIFSLVDGRRVVHSVELWSFDSTAPRWERRTARRNMVGNDSVLLCWGGPEPYPTPKFDVEILDIASGDVRKSFRLPLADVVAIQPIATDSYALLTYSGVYVLDAASKTVSQVMKMGPDDFLDFGALAVDSSMGKLIVVTAGNFERPGTHLIVVDL